MTAAEPAPDVAELEVDAEVAVEVAACEATSRETLVVETTAGEVVVLIGASELVGSCKMGQSVG